MLLDVNPVILSGDDKSQMEQKLYKLRE
jgi:hypothetical protein